ncbi:hypothetical protein [Okeania sp. KiyG1]|uniref:hypothetical protein n=1 Tax=Okeania sp. KiyG1 TaxID=2720165 RepID=UPI0019211393|nr:hypothetical protein [Okeania sp. KiyG1]
MGRWGDGEMGGWGDGGWGDGEMGRWGDGEMGGWGDGEMGRWGDGNPPLTLPGGNIEKDLAMAHRLEHFFIPISANLRSHTLLYSTSLIYEVQF